MKRYAARGEFGRPGIAGGSAACRACACVAMVVGLLQAGPVSAQGAGVEKSIIGSPAADFTLGDVEGHQVRLSDFKGKTVLLNFWATWCPPCKQELPTVQKIFEQYQGTDLVILAVDDEDPATIKDYLKAKHYSFTALVDSKRTLFREFAVHFIPTAIVISPEGIVTHEVTGWDGPQRLLDALRAAGYGNVPRGPAQPEYPRSGQRLLIATRKQETNR